MIDAGEADHLGRRVSLREVDDNWPCVADVAPRDDQRTFVFPHAARYLLLSFLEGEWRSLGIYADDDVVGPVMWAVDDDGGSHWIGRDGGRRGGGRAPPTSG
ncbi:hypothetical protein BH23ACT10_BH23ACT10_34510 [soil metagenome]